MSEVSRTTRERIADRLRERPLSASDIGRQFEVTTADGLAHVEHIAKSLETDEADLLVAPPTCRECGFDEFDDLVNRPSRCPDCKSESIEEPAFRIE